MFDKSFPCKKCTHAADRHYNAIVKFGESICLACAMDARPVDPNEHWHTFEGDNLKFMELQNKRKELLNE